MSSYHGQIICRTINGVQQPYSKYDFQKYINNFLVIKLSENDYRSINCQKDFIKKGNKKRYSLCAEANKWAKNNINCSNWYQNFQLKF